MRSAAPGMHSPPNASEASPATPTWNRSRFRQVGMRRFPAAGRGETGGRRRCARHPVTPAARPIRYPRSAVHAQPPCRSRSRCRPAPASGRR
jgi:hypothetical protein